MSRRATRLYQSGRPKRIRELPQKTLLARSISAAILASSLSATAGAQALEEMVVTATKRSESVQEVPLAISAFSGESIRDVNLDDVKDLVTFTPGVTGNSKDSFIDAISIRGIRTQDFGVGGDPSAAFFKNNLYEGRNGAVVTSLYDIDRAEVLRGPQGFLFGRNAIGGAFSVYTKSPNLSGERDGYVELDLGERDHYVGEGGATFGITDELAVRVAGYYSTEDGYVKNGIAPGAPDLIAHDKWALRFSGLFERGALSADFTVDYEQRDQSGSVYRASSLSPRTATFETIFGPFNYPADRRDTSADLGLGSSDDAEILTLGLNLEYALDWATLTSITGYKDHDYFYSEDYDSTPFDLNNYRQDQTGDYFQQELRLTSNTDGPLSWYAGVSYYEEEIDVLFTNSGAEESFCAYYGYYYGVSNCTDYFAYWQAYYPDAGVATFSPSSDGRMNEVNSVRGRFNGWAAYVDFNYAVTDTFDVGVGLRYTYDRKKFSIHSLAPESLLQSFFFPGFVTAEPVGDTADWDDFAPRFIARWIPNDDVTLYASVTKGFKSGGFGTFSLSPAIFQWFGDGPDAPITAADGFKPDRFAPEKIWSYEVGYKGTLFDGHANMDITAFYYDYTDLQVNFFDTGSRVGNADKAEGYGAEASVTASLNEYFDFYVAAGWLDTEATGIQNICGLPDPNGCEGNPIYWAPEFSGAAVLNAHYDVPQGEFFAAFEIFWESERGRGWEDIEDSQLDAYEEMAVRVGYRANGNWTITGYVENLSDSLTYDGAANNGGIVPAFYFGPSRPRTFGVKLGFKFD
jgi:iron complex outermembrane receptor protein